MVIAYDACFDVADREHEALSTWKGDLTEILDCVILWPPRSDLR